MALSKSQKDDVVKEVAELLGSSKMTVVAKYQGLNVKGMQTLRREARDNGTKVKVVKNRLVIKALQNNDKLKSIDTSALEGMLLYAFNGEDEVAAAQVLNTFAKKNPSLEFVGAISADGEFIDAAGVKSLAGLPGKNQLIAGIINTLNSPVRNVTSALNGLPAILSGLEAKANS